MTAVLVRLAVHDVNRDLQVHRAGDAGRRVPERYRNVVRDALHSLDLLRELGHRLEKSCRVEVLESAAQVVGDAGVPADEYHRTWRLERVRYAGNGVGYARAGGHYGDARLACDLRPSFGGMSGHLLMPEVYYLDSLGHTPLVEVVYVAAVEGEDVVHTFSLQRFGEQSPAVNLCHFISYTSDCVR